MGEDSISALGKINFLELSKFSPTVLNVFIVKIKFMGS